jgi:hypothetical protein
MTKGKWIALSVVLSISFLVLGAVVMNRARQRAKEAQKEDALIAWALQAEEQSHAAIRSDQEKLNNAQIKLDNDEVANDIAERDGRRKNIAKIRRDEGFIRAYRESIRREESWQKTCSEAVRTELEIAAHNRADPAHPEASASNIRKELCGGP